MARGATILILSDGWDRGDSEIVGEQMKRLHRVAHRIVWANPLKATPDYEPLAKGMAAALPHIDNFVEGNSLDSLKAGIKMVTPPHTPVPFSPPLEDLYLPSEEKVYNTAKQIL